MATNENHSPYDSAEANRKTTPTSANQQKPSPLPINWIIPLPTGTVTFLFTDIEGSTPLWERAPEKMAEALKIHNLSLLQAIKTHNGVVFKTVGDSFQAVFPTAPLALNAAIEGQRLLQSASWNELGPLNVRMGLHTGEAELDPGGDEYAVSHTKNRASRLMSAGHGGQILLSQECADLCMRGLPESIVLRDLGPHRLKGLARLERLFQVVAPGLPADFPALQTLDLFPNNLPLELTSFIGREKESAQAQRLLEQTRLLTFTGVGGTGKTRLALHVAGEVLQDFEQGAWLVELARLTDSTLILPSVAAVFGFFEDRADMRLETRLLYHLQNRQLLLILDNCEHMILEAAQLVDKILHATPLVKILVTSREALGLAGEVIYQVPSLFTPDPDHLPPLEDLPGFDAIQLFLERACAVLPGFTLTQANATQVAQICRRLDGIPLAIELAAARVKVFSTEQICQRLDQRFRLLTGGSRSALPRHQALRATIDWSYGLLSEAEKGLLRRLSVFMGGWSLAAAEAVCALPRQDEEVFDLLAHLVNKSLLEVERSGGEVHRYRMLETVRQYAQEKLDESGEFSQMRDRHLDYFLRLAEDFEDSLKSLKNVERVRWLKVDLENFRAGLNWAYGAGSSEQAAQGLRLASSLYMFWSFSNLLGEGLDWLKKGLELLGKEDEKWIRVRAKALRWAADGSVSLDYNQEGGVYSRQSEKLYRRCDDPLALANALITVVNCSIYLEPGHPLQVSESERMALLKEGEAVIRAANDELGLFMLFQTKLWAVWDKEYALNESQFVELRSLVRGTIFEGVEYHFLAVLAERRGDFGKSFEYYQKSLEFYMQSGLKGAISFNLLSLAGVALNLGKKEQAQAYSQRCAALAIECGQKSLLSSAMNFLIRFCLDNGEYQQVGKYLLMDLSSASEFEIPTLVAHCLLPLVSAAEKMLQSAETPRFLGYIEKNLVSFWAGDWTISIRHHYEHISAEVQARMGETAFRAGFEAGKNMSREQVLAEARLLAEKVSHFQ